MFLKTAFHLLMGIVFSCTIYYDLYVLQIPEVFKIRHERSSGRWKYLTFWNLIAQAIFFSLSFINDVLERNKSSKDSTRGRLRIFLDVMFSSVGFPVSIFVGSTFWVLWNIDRELVLPKVFDIFFPTFLNHLMHTLIIPAVLIEMFCFYHKYPRRKLSLSILSFFTLVYLIWVFIVAYVFQFWTYPILEVLNWGQRTIFIVVCIASTWIYYFIGEYLHYSRWKPSILNWWDCSVKESVVKQTAARRKKKN